MKSSGAPTIPSSPGPVRLAGAAVADPTNQALRATDLLVELGREGPARESQAWPTPRTVRVLAAGTKAEVDTHPAAASAPRLELPGSVLLPAFANAHAHLDLTHMGPMPHDPHAGFVSWIERVRAGRAQTPEEISASVRRGVDLSLRAGVALVGDIAGASAGLPQLESLRTLAQSPMSGVSFLEFFAIGSRETQSLDRVRVAIESARRMGMISGGPRRVRLGIQPHAPNTVSLSAYRFALELAGGAGLPLATHLAESVEEHEFIADASGPQRAMLERLGIWTDEILDHVGKGQSPVAHLAPVLRDASARATPFIVAHVNDTDRSAERDLQALADSETVVAYCPRASAYFGADAHFGPHRYREMLDAGVRVGLGTDSVLNLPEGVDASDGAGISTLDEARLLFARDGTDAHVLHRMCTVNTARALGWPEEHFALTPSSGVSALPLGILAIDVSDAPETPIPFQRVLRSNARPRFLALASHPEG